MGKRSEAVLTLTFGPASTPTLPRALSCAREHADSISQVEPGVWRATFRLEKEEDRYGRAAQFLWMVSGWKSTYLGLLIDAARFAENCYLVREREPGQSGRSIGDIAAELFSLADAVAMSAKKDALVNMGGFLGLRDEADFQACRPWAVLYEGYLTYGGMAGRDLEAVARGLIEGMDEAYLAARMEQVRLLHTLLDEVGVPLVRPPGGHSVVIDAPRFVSHLPRSAFPAESLAVAMYLEGGMRTVGLGGLAFGDHGSVPEWAWPLDLEYLRMAIPRRVYTDNHIAYAAAVARDLWAKREEIGGLRAVEVPETLPHFTAVFEPL